MRLLRGTMVTAAVAVATLVTAAPVVGAQEDEATLTVDQVHPAGGSVHYIVELTDADGEAVEGATVTATPTSPSGAEGATTTLGETGDGVYEGPVQMDINGDWTVIFESSAPAARLEHDQTIPVTAATEEDEGSGSTVVVMLAGLFVVAVGAIVTWVLVRKPGADTGDVAEQDDEAHLPTDP